MLCKNIRKTREKLKMTQTEVAERVGIRRQTYCDIEQGLSNPSVRILKRIEDIYGVTMDELAREEKYNNGS